MGIDFASLNDRQREMIRACDRPKGRRGATFAQAEAKRLKGLERDLHNMYHAFLWRNGFKAGIIYSDPRRRPTIAVGHPDFSVYRGGKVLFGEFKVKPNKLSPAQQKRIEELLEEGNTVFVWYDYQSAVRDTTRFFGL